MDSCVFCKIIKGELPSAKVWEDEHHIAFLSIAPINPGHTLVISKKHIEYLFDMEDQEIAALMVVCKPIAHALQQAFMPATGRVGVMVAGGEVPHVHIHLIPMNSETDLTFARAKHGIPFEELEKNAEKIIQALKNQDIK